MSLVARIHDWLDRRAGFPHPRLDEQQTAAALYGHPCSAAILSVAPTKPPVSR